MDLSHLAHTVLDISILVAAISLPAAVVLFVLACRQATRYLRQFPGSSADKIPGLSARLTRVALLIFVFAGACLAGFISFLFL
ncbi:MAG: hypothetical protein Q3986_06420 [Akkermansia sp.]|nr:hypothetical protein [Akkermansia sp.]